MSANDIAIRVENLSKCYHVYDEPQDRLKQSLWLGRKQFYREFWSLRDVSFDIRKGETVGIIGRNGSGKSTLLQLIAGTLSPTSGSVSVHGRVAALLELGSGFSPDFTGRENIYMNGAILGLSHPEITARFDDIVAFADIGNFIEQPVKVYSSGMYMRLAFAIAVSVDPAILIVDEALAVGDEMFQRKCFARIQAIQQSGAAVLFVSHSAQSVIELCGAALLLDQGELILSGRPKPVVAQYHKLIYAPDDKRAALREAIRGIRVPGVSPQGGPEAVSASPSSIPASIHASDTATYDPALIPQSTVSYESQGARIGQPQITRLDGTPANVLVNGQTYCFGYSVFFTEAAFSVIFGMLLKTTRGFELGGCATATPGQGEAYIAPGTEVSLSFQFRCSLLPGVYFLNAGCLGLVNGEEHYLHRLIDAAMFRVLPIEDNIKTGIVDFEFEPMFEISRAHGQSTGIVEECSIG